MNYGSDALKKAVIPDVLAGKKFIALAISEAFAGSDVAGLRCTAKKTPVSVATLDSHPPVKRC
jgi:alkylation response protein AidB-like acyl-CoA dehydrogenase